MSRHTIRPSRDAEARPQFRPIRGRGVSCEPMRGQICVSLVIYTGWPRGEDVRESVTAPVSNINNGHVHKNVKMTLSKRYSSQIFNAKTIDRICSSGHHVATHEDNQLIRGNWPPCCDLNTHIAPIPCLDGQTPRIWWTPTVVTLINPDPILRMNSVDNSYHDISVHPDVFTIIEGVWVTWVIIWPLSGLLRSRVPRPIC